MWVVIIIALIIGLAIGMVIGGFFGTATSANNVEDLAARLRYLGDDDWLNRRG